jgi:hypothetical protein
MPIRAWGRLHGRAHALLVIRFPRFKGSPSLGQVLATFPLGVRNVWNAGRKNDGSHICAGTHGGSSQRPGAAVPLSRTRSLSDRFVESVTKACIRANFEHPSNAGIPKETQLWFCDCKAALLATFITAQDVKPAAQGGMHATKRTDELDQKAQVSARRSELRYRSGVADCGAALP